MRMDQQELPRYRHLYMTYPGIRDPLSVEVWPSLAEGDNPPTGLLLCRGKGNALLEYIRATIDNDLFVSKCQLELPTRNDSRRVLEERHREVGA